MNKKTATYFSLGMISGIALLFILGFTSKDFNPFQVKEDGRVQLNYFPPQLPKTMKFANEPVPLSRQEIKESLDREMIINTYGHSNTIYILKFSGKSLFG